jgi:hypothetical protein
MKRNGLVAKAAGVALVFAGVLGLTLSSSGGSVRVVDPGRVEGLFGACGNVSNSRSGCGLGSCSTFGEQFDIVAGGGNIKQSVGSCAYLTNGCGSYHTQASCR